MKMHLLEQKGKLFYQIAEDFAGITNENQIMDDDNEEEKLAASVDDQFDRYFIKGHKKAITCMEWLPDNRSIITGSKDCSLIKWDLETQKKQFFRGDRWNKNHKGHFDEVISCAVS